MRKQIALFTTVAALAITPALAQAPAPAPDTQPAPQVQPAQPPAGDTTPAPQTDATPTEQFINTQTSDQVLASELMGLRVMGTGDENIGSVSDLLVDDEGNIIAAVVGVGGFLGIGQKSVAISFDTLNVTQDADGNAEARITLTKEELENAPDFKSAAEVRREAQRQAPASPGGGGGGMGR